MSASNDYLHPRLLEIQHYHKPPLTYYITALGYKIFGLNEFGARFFLQIALLLQILLTYKIGQLLFQNDRIALYASIIYFTFPIVLISTNNLTTDAYLTTFVISGIYFWLLYKVKEKPVGLYFTALVIGLGFMTKGPVIFLPFLIFIFTYKSIFKKKSKFKDHLIFSIILFFGISLPWFIKITMEFPELWNYFFETHTLKRVLNAEHFNRDQPFWYFLVYAPLVGLPWFLFMITLLIKKWKIEIKRNAILKLLLFNMSIILLLFSIFSSKMILYVLPVYLYVALLSAYFMQNVPSRLLELFINSYKLLFLLLLFGLSGLILFKEITIKPGLLFLLGFILIGDIVLVFSKIFKSQKRRLFSISLIFTCTLLFTFRVVANQNPYWINSTRSLAAEIKNIEHETGKKKVVIFDSRLSSLPFYLDQKTTNIHLSKFETKREILFERNKAYLRYYWDINHEQELQELVSFLKNREGIFITKDSKIFEDPIQNYLKSMKFKKVNKWLIYY